MPDFFGVKYLAHRLPGITSGRAVFDKKL
jgi:hypothetical protein